MRHGKKILALCLCLLLCVTAAAAALDVGDAGAEAGQTAVLTFTFREVWDVDGAFTVSDPKGIVERYEVGVAAAGATTATVSGDRFWAAPSGDPVSTTVKVEVRLSLKAEAPIGESCTVSFMGTYGDAGQGTGSQTDVYQAASVTVQAPPPAAASEPTPTPVPTPKPINYKTLNKQIGIAEGLNTDGYTAISVQALEAALTNARTAAKSTSQNEVNAAAKSLESAVAGLVKMDHSKLRKALAAAEEFVGGEALAGQWKQLNAAVTEGTGLLSSADQAAVDAAAARIADEVAQLQADLAALKTPELVEVEVPVEVLPSGDFCNVTGHTVWKMLFGISAAANVVLVVVIVAYTVKKKKFQNDDTPLVDYDIGDDYTY